MKQDVVALALAIAREHPARKLARRNMVVATGFATVGAFALAWSPFASVPCFLYAAWAGWAALHLTTVSRPLTLINLAHDRFRRGQREEAKTLVDACERVAPPRYVRRSIAIHRALHAFDASDMAAVVGHTSAAVDARVSFFLRAWEHMQVGAALGLRALARASLHDDAGALADAKRAREPQHASPSALAHAELAQAVIAANAGQKDGMRDALARAAPFLDELDGRTQALFHVLERHARDEKRSIYRHAAKSDDANPLDAWIAHMVPTAAVHGGGATLRTTTELPALSDAKAVASPARRTRVDALGRQGRRALALWVLLICMFLAIWQFLNSGQTGSSRVPVRPVELSSAVMFMAALSLILTVLLVVRATRAVSQRLILIRAASIALRRGEDGARAKLERLALAGSPDAALELARDDERHGAFDAAIALCDSGLASANATLARRVGSYDLAAPGLAAERAFCLAALGRIDEASAELAHLPNRDGYAYAAAAHFRVQLAQALARGDRCAALEVARARGDTLVIPSRDALLVDLLEATEGSGADAETWSRLHAELASNVALAKWIDHFLPGITRQAPKARIAETEVEEEVEEAQVDFGAVSS